MSRYPGTQFRVYDNSQVAAIVPVNGATSSSAVTYLSAFRSVKGPEKITYTRGQNFYTRYGTQDNIKFDKYGQPLFQASMNINNGANLYAKRAVLDDATLGNATFCIALTKYKEHTVTVDSDRKDVIQSVTIPANADAKYSLAPLVVSVDNANDYVFANDNTLNETKERYNLYKDFIVDVVSNQNNSNNEFLNRLDPEGKGRNIVLSGYTESIYYDVDGNVISDPTAYSAAHSINSISISTNTQTKTKTVSTQFDPISDIVNSIDTSEAVTVDGSAEAVFGDRDQYYVIACGFDGTTWNVLETTTIADLNQTGNGVYILDSMSKITYTELKNDSEEMKNRIATEVKSFARTLFPLVDGQETATAGECVYITNIPDVKQYSDPMEFVNSLLISKANCVELEYVFPMFTVFDNGRGDSTKSISVSFNANSSKTQKKATYNLNVYNYSTSKQLETFTFSFNPYDINPNTGYSYDIESAVNNRSEQISVRSYYDSYDKYLATLQAILETTSETLVTDYDTVFGHNMNGTFPTFSSYNTSRVINRTSYTYDYAHLDIFANDILTVNAYCAVDNMADPKTVDSKVKYYYYNANRNNLGIYEKLEYGSDGYVLAMTDVDPTTKPVYAVIDTQDRSLVNKNNLNTFIEIVETTGQINGTVVKGYDDTSAAVTPIVQRNFISRKLYTYPMYNVAKNDSKAETIVDANIIGYVTYNSQAAGIKGYATVGEIFDGDTARTNCPYCVDTSATAKTFNVWVPYTEDALYQQNYQMFYNGDFDRDIFNLDVYFPNAVFDANYSKATKLAIQRLAAFRGDFMAYMDMGIGEVTSYQDCAAIIPSTNGGLDLVESDTNKYYYIRDMHVAVTALSYSIRDPYTNKVISVTGTYGLSNLYIGHFARNTGGVFAGISNGITIGGIIEGTANYIPKIYPTSEMNSLNNISGVYPSDDETIVNEKQLMNDLRVNYGCYYEDRFSIETEYTMHASNSEFAYWNNVALVCLMMQSVRQECPTARYQFVTADDLSVYQAAVNAALEPWRDKFATIKFEYLQDDDALANKIYYAAIEVAFKPFAQSEIFTLTALNYASLSENVTTI